jgi:hypothetical protein
MLHSVIRSQMAHVALPAGTCNTLQNMIDTFISPMKRLPQELLHISKEDGGLGSPLLKTTKYVICMQHAVRAINNPDLVWVQLMYMHLDLCFLEVDRTVIISNLILQPHICQEEI